MGLTADIAPGSGSADLPIDDHTFAGLMTRLRPFEPTPRAAVAVSGGADSMALCLLADRWARAQGGSILALTVDHRLRPGSAREAETVADWLGRRRVDHRVLPWCEGRDGIGAGSLQAAARAARYRILQAACAEAGILHLLLAHTLDDQAETVLLRLAKGSGVDGLAAMPVVRETGNLRLLRPLLGVAKQRLQATCRQSGQQWIDDPSNLSPDFARGRLRRVSAALKAEGLSPDRLADTARRAGRARAALEAAANTLLARVAAIHPEGYVTLDRTRWLDAPEELALRALSRCLLTVGAGRHAPRLERLERLYEALRSDACDGGRTLAGCRVLRDKSDRLLVCREPAAAETMTLPRNSGAPAAPVHWDGRFLVTPPTGRMPAGLELRRLGVTGRKALKAAGLTTEGMPATAMLSLPGLWDGEQIFALPQIVSLQRRPISCKLSLCGVRFAPSRRLTDPAFAVV